MKLNQKGLGHVILAVVIVAVLVIGAGYYVLQKDSDNSDQNSTTPTAVDTASGKIKPPYRISISITDSADKTKDSTITLDYESDKKWKSVTKSPEGNAEIVFTGDYTYITSGGKTIRAPYSSGNTNNSTAVDAYNLTDDQVNAYKTGSTQQADQACGSGTCEVFKITNSTTFDTAELFIDKSTQNFVKLVSVSGTATT